MSTAATCWQDDPTNVGRQRRAVAVLFVAQAVAGLGTGAATGMGSLLAYEVTRDENLAGISRIVGALSVAVLAIPLASAAVRHGRRVALSLGWGMSVAGAAVLVGATRWHSLVLLMLGMFLFGGGQAASLQSRFAATDMATPQRRAATLSFVLWAGTIGSVIGPNLVTPGAVVGRWLHVPEIAGTYALCAGIMLLAALTVALLLRPDPMRVAQEHGESPAVGRKGASWAALASLWRDPLARLAVVALPLNQMVMTGVMTLTPVHMHQAGFALSLVGITLSGHILGMYAFAPLVGWLADRIGRPAIIGSCVGLHGVALTCCAVGGGRSLALLLVGLFLLGLGWSFGMVAGSALIVERVEAEHRTAAQGAVDTCMNIAAAVAAGAAGPVLAALGFAGLAAVFAIPAAVIAGFLIDALRRR